MDQRILKMYSRLIEGKVLYKKEEAAIWGVSERTIQRDLEELRTFFADSTPETGVEREVLYDANMKAYRLEPPMKSALSNDEIFAITKILLESRSMKKEELRPIIDKLVGSCYPESERKIIDNLLKNERFHYIEPQHKSKLISKLWDLAIAVNKHNVIKIKYNRHYDKKVIERTLQPVGIMFAEYYFYLIANFDESDTGSKKDKDKNKFPIVYRIDRMEEIEVLEKKFAVPYMSRFEEGEFRKRIQFMFTGELTTVKFWCADVALEAIQDRLPTAKIVKQPKDGGFIIEAEVYGGEGVEMWLRSQGKAVKKVKLKK